MPSPSGSRLRPWLPVAWIALSGVCLFVDFCLGPYIQFPIVYLIPVSLAAWNSGLIFGLALAVVLPLFRLYFITMWDPPWTFTESLVNAFIRIAVLALFAWLIDRTARQTRRLASEVTLLTGMLPVCAKCHKIRDTQGGWQQLETYMAKNPEEFRRELCVDCAKVADDLFDRR